MTPRYLARRGSRRAVTPAKILAVVIGSAVLSSCVTPYNPFRVPREELRRRVHTIAVAPVIANSFLVDRAAVRQRIEPRIEARLRQGGFQVVPSDIVEGLWRDAAENIGGVFDPITGKPKDEHFQAVKDAVERELRVAHRADAILHSAVMPTQIYLTGRTATYCDRTDDPVYWPASAISRFELATMVQALCLTVELDDLEGRPLYRISYGLEIFETYIRQTRAERPRAERLQDLARIDEALDKVLGPLTQ